MHKIAFEFRKLSEFKNVPIIHGRYETDQKSCSSTQRLRTGQLGNLPLLNWPPDYWDYEMSLKKHVCRVCVHAYITSSLDYCNSLLAKLPDNLIQDLQRVQNAAARLVVGLRKFDHITPSLISLHWLPVKKKDCFFKFFC